MKISGLVGSLRSGSYNCITAEKFAEIASKYGATLDIIKPQEYDLPVYNQDVETNSQQTRDAVIALQGRIMQSDALLLFSPEYCGGVPGALKNAVDWLSRPIKPGSNTYEAFIARPMGIIITTVSSMGGVRSMEQWRMIAGSLGSVLIPGNLLLQSAQNWNEQHDNFLQGFVENFVNFSKKHK